MPLNLVITAARLREDSEPVDVGVSSGEVAELGPSGSLARNATEVLDAAGQLLIPPFIDPHFHLDKVLSRDVLGVDSAEDAFFRAREAKASFTVEGVEERATRALHLAAAHGIGGMRAQVDVDSFTRLTSLEGVLAARARCQHLVDVEIVAFPQEGIVADPETRHLLREALRMGAEVVGGLPEREATEADRLSHMNIVFEIAEEFSVPVDMHIDYMDDPELKTLEPMARITIERGFQGRVVADHCCALATYPDGDAQRVIGLVQEADIGVNVLPIANLQMLGGSARTPTTRGSSRLGELIDAGVRVAAGFDNMYDIWFRFGRMDPSELALVTCLSAGLRTDQDVRIAFEMTNVRAAAVLGRETSEIKVGSPADFVILNATSIVEFVRNLPGKRVLIRDGKQVASLETKASLLSEDQ